MIAHRAHAVLAEVSLGYPPQQGRFPRATHPCATPLETEIPKSVRLACVRHAASVRSEPGSNSQVHPGSTQRYSLTLRQTQIKGLQTFASNARTSGGPAAAVRASLPSLHNLNQHPPGPILKQAKPQRGRAYKPTQPTPSTPHLRRSDGIRTVQSRSEPLNVMTGALACPGGADEKFNQAGVRSGPATATRRACDPGAAPLGGAVGRGILRQADSASPGTAAKPGEGSGRARHRPRSGNSAARCRRARCGIRSPAGAPGCGPRMTQ